MTAIVHAPGEGERLAVGPSHLTIKATGEDTAGAFFLSETTLAAGSPGPPLHRHRELVDMFYVLEGALTFQLDDGAHELSAGSFVCVPAGTAHTFSNQSEGPVRFLNFNTPAGWEKYMRDLADLAAREQLRPQAIGAIASRYDFEAV